MQMTLKNVLFFGFLTFATLLNAQYSFKEHYFELNKNNSNSERSVEFTGSYFLNSTTFNNALTNKIVFSGYLDEQLKNDNLKRSNSLNLLNGGIGGQMRYKNSYKSFNLTSAVSTNLVSANQFTKGFYQLLLFGNKPFAGETINLKNADFYSFAYNKVSIGAEKMFKNNTFFGGSLSVYQSLNFTHNKFERGTIYTHPTGEQIDIDLKYSQLASKSKQNWGAGIDLYFTHKYEKTLFIVLLEDFGWIKHKQVLQVKSDTSIQFQGIEIANILALGSENLGNKDGIQANDFVRLDSSLKAHYYQFLPFKMTIGMQEKINSNWFLELYANYQKLPHYIPQLIVKPNYFFGKYFSIAPIFTVGGFGKSDFGLNASLHTSKFYVILDSYEIESLLLPKKTSGRMSAIKTGFLF
jgi:hypothetical protein